MGADLWQGGEMGADLWQGGEMGADLAARIPWRCLRPFAEFGVLPDAGGYRDQPHLLMLYLECLAAGWKREKAHQETGLQQALLQALGRG